MKKRILALLLALTMVISLFGCQKPQTEEPSTEPSTEPATEPAPNALELYADACAALNKNSALTWDVVTDKTTALKDQSFEDHTEQVLTCVGVGTDNPVIRLEQTLSIEDTNSAGETVESDALYSEVYADGTLYVSLETRGSLSGPMDPEAMQSRYVPAVLFDSALYQDVTVEENGEEATVTFAAASAGESWAVPAGAELLEATGTAVLTGGAVKSMTYTVTYRYGSATVEQTTTVTPRAEALTAAVPEDADTYVAVQCPEALLLIQNAKGLVDQVQSGSFTGCDSIFSQAGGVVRNLVTYVDYHDVDDKLSAKIENSLYLMDYSTGESYEMDLEEVYHNGKYTYTMDDSVPTSQPGVDADLIRDYRDQTVIAYVPRPEFWSDVTGEDLGSLYYFEFTYNEDFGSTIQNLICNTLYNDPTLLNSAASSYTTDVITGYAAIDKYTGLFTACGYYYEGTHIIDGDPYILTDQLDQSFTMPSYGAYYAVAEELLPEEEPEQKATPLFYKVTGADGQQMYLFGTIHVGDERTAYLPQEIYDAFAASDALAIECDTEAFDEQVEEDEDLADEVSDLYFYTDGSMTKDHVDEETYNQALKYLKATGNYNMNAEYMKPSVWSNAIENFYLTQGCSITAEQGVEERLTKLAEEQDKPILEVESSLFQIQMSTGWSEDLQELLLEGALDYSGDEYFMGVQELYEMWCEGDEATLREYLSDEVDTSEMTEEDLAEYEEQKHLYEEYDTAMSYDRNDGMLEKAIEYLESGDVIFYAVGLAHLLDGHNGLVDALRAAGYTVELVPYA